MDYQYFHVLGMFVGAVIGWVIMINFPFESLTVDQGMAIAALGGFYAGHLIDKRK